MNLTQTQNKIEKNLQELLKKKPRISFVMPQKGDAKFVATTVASILDQDWPAIEVIVVNDGKDKAAEKALKPFQKDIRFKLFTLEKSQGACVARNFGAKQATGKYLSFLPADAKLYPGVARHWIELLEAKPEFDFFYGGYRFVTEEWDRLQNHDYPSQPFDPYLLEVTNFIDGSFPLRTETFWEAAKLMNQPDGLWDSSVKSLQDWDFWLSVVKEGGKKGFYEPEIFFETILPHKGGLSDDSANNWVERTDYIKRKHKIPDRKICVTSLGAPFHGVHIAKSLDADFKVMPPQKPYTYDMIYSIGYYPIKGLEHDMTILSPEAYAHYDYYMRLGEGIPVTTAKKVAHLIGTDILQFQILQKYKSAEFSMHKQILQGRWDKLLVEFEATKKEMDLMGFKGVEIVPLPPREFFEVRPLPKQFTVAIYQPSINEDLYNPLLTIETAKRFPNIRFIAFGGGQVSQVKNLEVVPRVEDMDKFLTDVSCLLRITDHDGLPQTALEFLSAGRQVIFDMLLEHCIYVPVQEKINWYKEKLKESINLAKQGQISKAKKAEREAKKIFDNVLTEISGGILKAQKLPLNEKGAEWVRKEFSKEKFRERINKILNEPPIDKRSDTDIQP